MSPGLFRLALASVVVAAHFTPFFLGSAAVALFFVLSGYWIATMWREKYRHAPAPYLIFLVSRFWRLLPVFLLATAAALPVAHCRPQGWSWLPNVALLGYSQIACKPLTPAWSLDVEMQFYIVAPALMLVAAQGAVARWSLLAAGAISLLAVDFYLLGGSFLIHGLLYFTFGMLAAQQGWQAPRWLVNAGVALAVVLVAILMAHPTLRGTLWIGAHRAPSAIYSQQVNAAVALLLTPFALSTVVNKSSELDRAFGDLSYIVYLIHWPVVVFARDHFYAGGGLGKRLLVLAVAGTAIYLASVLIWFYFDRPMNRLRVAFVNRRVSRPAKTAQPSPAAP